MVDFMCSRISAHHNYWINGMATPGFVVGDPGSPGDFYFLADVVLAGEKTHRIHARLFDDDGSMLTEILWNRIGRNPGRCRFEMVSGGFRITKPDGNMLIEAYTSEFTNGFMTYIRGLLYDEQGAVRMEPEQNGARITGEARLVLEAPFALP